ncbi:disintegrin and metalloproteinase domain-containing protein 10-like [Diabrotica undecimpunctata]|uniref:disintegrin and metalloproteinase domain-containing protein 10-like n=1 Tax=Diabrotica undecimpunctata TaxID=50387 RepID=UPI003B642077
MVIRVVCGVLVTCFFGNLLHCSPLDPVKHIKDFNLNSWIRHYEPAQYDPQSLVSQHIRVRRSSGSERGRYPLRLDIRGHNRLFKLRLFPDEELFANDISFESTGGVIKFDPTVVYTGNLEDDGDSVVHGLITKEGIFEGTIFTASEEYHVEPVSRYLSQKSMQKPSFHSVIYKASDVHDPRKGQSCASHRLHQNSNLKKNQNHRKKRWLLEAEAKLPPSYDDPPILFSPNRTRRPFTPIFDLNQPIDEELEMFTNRSTLDASGLIFRNVNKRATVDPKKTTCMLYLQADHQFFSKYGTEEACIEVMTRHVQRVNAIYRNTDFNQDGKSDNITFMVKRIKVHTLEALKDPLYRFPNNYGVEKFLELFSEEDYDAFCLAYMFTYRDFEMGTLGLAWTGDLKNAGGVCEKNGHYRGSMKSLNTGIVTLLNYGKHVPPAVSHVTLAHEIGHNFGSPHDPEQCSPGGEDGNFIMFARATSGDKKNNNRFSPCSLKSINPVLNFKARSPKGCFTEPKVAICGNGVVEEGEECDCGWEEDCRDQCCFPMRRYATIDEPPCRLTPRSACSPSQGPCCTSNCQVKFGDKCRDDNGCRDESFCNGRDPQCPPSINKPNKTICNKEFVCFMGECTGSICLAYGLESCQCIPSKNDPKTKACELCCKLPGDNQPCLSSFEWNDMPYDIPDMYSKPGTPCNNYIGYCDVFQMCREVDPSGPLATLRKLLLSDESIASFKKWIIDYWYAVAMIIAAVIALLVLSTKYLGKKPNFKLKSVTIIHKSPTEAVRLPPDGEGVTVHPGVRSKLPLKRKVRDGKMKRKRKGKVESINNNLNSPNKSKVSPKKKKRVSAAVVAEEVKTKPVDTKVFEVPNNKVKRTSQAKPAKKKKKKNEIIDYSSIQADLDGKKGSDVIHTPLTPESDPVGKVQNWLLKSQYALPKSKSTPVGLTDKTRRSPHKRPTIRPRTDKSKSHSVGNIPSEKEKVRLQVVYKPPFKFSVKLRKPEKTSVIIERVPDVVKKPEKAPPRTGVLVRTLKETESSKPPPPPPQIPLPPIPVSEQSVDVVDHHSSAANIDSNIHTVQSDLEVLLSESEFLFSDD